MAYQALSERVNKRLRELNGERDQPAESERKYSLKELEQMLRHGEPASKPEPRSAAGGFEWQTPERVRSLAERKPAAKKKGGFSMSIPQAIRELRKLKRPR